MSEPAVQANALADRMNDVASLNSTVIVYKDDSYGTDLATDTYAELDGPLALLFHAARARPIFVRLAQVDRGGVVFGSLV